MLLGSAPFDRMCFSGVHLWGWQNLLIADWDFFLNVPRGATFLIVWWLPTCMPHARDAR